MFTELIQISDPRWFEFVARHPKSTVFHHPAWSHLMQDCYGYQPDALILMDEAQHLIAGMPVMEIRKPFGKTRWVSLPFTDYCPPLAQRDTDLSTLHCALIDWGKINGELEVRAPLPEGERTFPKAEAVIHTLRLNPDEQSVFRTFKKTQVQQPIVKAERDGVVVIRTKSPQDLDRFYQLHLATRRRLGTPVQPRRFFQLFWDQLIGNDLGFLLMAFKDSVPIAGAMFLAWNGTVIYKYSASDPTHWKLRPNNALLWTAIRWGCQNGYHTFDFGRTDLDDPGLRDFKRGWGTQELPLVYSWIANKPPQVSRGRLRHWMGSVIRRSPPWVCRAIGEVFYKYAA